MNGLGRHILAEFYGCSFDRLNDLELLKGATLEAVAASGATIMSHHFKTFTPQGVSGVIVIAESHLSFHTWPEHGYIAIDYFTCGDQVDIHLTIDLLERALGPDHTERVMHWRGQELAQLPHCPTGDPSAAATTAGSAAGTDQGPTATLAGDRERWVTEYHRDPASGRRELGFQYRVTEELHRRRSAFQDIAVVEGPIYGRMLLIDGYMMTTERDEFVYHEMLGHVPLMLHPAPRRIAIIGGGDGGLLREVLRHPTVEAVDLVEIDPEVIAVSRAHLPGLATGFDDPRAALHAVDGARFLSEAAAGTYDVVLVDSTDPIGPGEVLFQAPFYRAACRALAPGGLLGAQALSPWVQAPAQAAMFAELGRVFPTVHAYHATVPTYPGGLWMFALCGASAVSLTAYDRERALTLAEACRYYTPEIQLAAFHLPGFVRATTVDAAAAARESGAFLPSAPPCGEGLRARRREPEEPERAADGSLRAS